MRKGGLSKVGLELAEELIPFPRQQPMGHKPRLREHRGLFGALLLSCSADFFNTTLSRAPETDLDQSPTLGVHSRESEGRRAGEGRGRRPCLSVSLKSGSFALSPGVEIPSGSLWGGAMNTPGQKGRDLQAARAPSSQEFRSHLAPWLIRAVAKPFILVSTRYYPLNLQLKMQMEKEKR